MENLSYLYKTTHTVSTSKFLKSWRKKSRQWQWQALPRRRVRRTHGNPFL